jgi:ABC-type transport system involved in cytochrome bd biosynthesis fused ATPase/permease subunit
LRGMFIGIMLLLIVVLSFSAYMYKLTNDLSQDLSASLEQLKQAVEEGEWEKAAKDLQQLNRSWKKADAWWTPLMDHRELDNLDQTITRVSSFIQQRKQEEAFVEISVSRRLVEKIRERESLSMRNIF